MNHRRYTIELGLSLAAYAILLVLSNYLHHRLEPQGMALIAVALLPCLAIGFIAWAILRQLRVLDEMQRRIQLDALAFAFASTALLTLGWGFAENAGLRRLPTFAIWPIMGSLWVIGLFIARRRYGVD
jgi:hypothetical protein